MKTKKLLAILLSLALLIGLVPVAGMLTTGAASEETDPTVYEIAFDAKEKVDLGYYVSNGNYTTTESNGTTMYTTVYDVSFDYYLDCETEGALSFSYQGLSGGSSTLTKGLHSVNFQVTRVTDDKNNAFTPCYTAVDDLAVECTLYAWNLVVKANDVEIKRYVHDPWQCSFTEHGVGKVGVDCGRTTATVTSEKTLADYHFEAMAIKVYEIKFEETEKFDVGYYDKSTANAAWNFTFEYYLDCDTDDPFTFVWNGQNVSAETGSYVLQKGRHTATFGATVTSTAISPRFTAKAGVSGTLYVWNLKVTMNGEATGHHYHGPWQCTMIWNGETHTCERTTASVTSDKSLADYPFCLNSDGSVKTKEVYVDQSFSDPTVYEIEFEGGETFSLGHYSKKADNAVWEATFEYFLAGTENVTFSVAWSATTTNHTTSIVLEPGLHTVTLTATCSSALCPILKAPSGASGTLYAWNLVVTANDAVKDFYVHDPWQCTCENVGTTCNRTTASVNSGEKLSTYSFAEHGSQYYPYTTLYDAMQAIESSLHLEGVINIIGTYTNTDQYEMVGGAANTSDSDVSGATPSDYVVPITIQGAVGKGTNILYTGASMWMYGPTTFNNITLRKDTSEDGSFTIVARHNALHFGDNVGRVGHPYLVAGLNRGANNDPTTKKHELTVGTYVNTVYLGNYMNSRSTDEAKTAARSVPGVNYVQSTGATTVYTLVIGSYGSTGGEHRDGGTLYTDDVNITVNVGKIGTSKSTTNGILIDGSLVNSESPTDFGGNAVQIIFNNGTSMGDASNNKFPTAEEIKERNGDLYVLHCAAGVSQLATTDEAGVYTVADPSWVAVATDTTDATKVYRSKNGKLTVPAGTYTVGWDVEDSANGYHFDFDSEQFDSSFMSTASNYTNINLFYAKSFNTSATGKFRYSFDYYMPEQSEIYVSLANAVSPIMADETTGTGYLQQGRHTFSCTFDTADYIYSTATTLGFASYYDWYRDQIDGAVDGKCYGESLLPGDLYVWNVRLTDLSNNVVKRTTYDGVYEGCGKDCVTEVNIDELNLDMQNNTSVYELDFTDSEEENPYAYIPLKQTMTEKTDATAGYQYIISFDYYLLGNAPVARARFGTEQLSNPDGTAILRNVAEGENNDYNFDVGRHTFKAVVTRDMFNTTLPLLCFELDDDGSSDTAKLYVWNLQFYCSKGAVDSVKGNLLHGGLIIKSSEASKTVATVTDVPTTELTPELQLDMHSAQYREDYSLRFIAAIKGASITRQDGGEALYDDTATITIGRIPYKVVGAGVLFGRDKRIAKIGTADAVLTLENVNEYPNVVYDIFAEKLQSDVYHAQYLGEDNEGVVYTGVIKSIPRANWDETLSARAYVTLEGADGKVQTVYGNILSRSLMQVKPSTEPSSKYTDEQATAKKDAILGADNTEIPAGATVYYVSNTVGDENEPEGSIKNPFTTLDEVNALSDGTAQKPIVVLFERGCEWRGSIEARSYTTYGSYGSMEEPKPAILGSWMDYATLPAYKHGEEVTVTGESGLYWQQLDAKFGNRWQLVGLGKYLSAKNPAARAETGANVGNMLFFDEYGIVNGSMSNSERIYQDYEFYHKVTTGTDSSGETVVKELGDLYVYLPEGKTPKDFTRIEIADDRMIIEDTYDDKSLENVTIDNLCLMYTGGHGISMVGTSNYPVKNITITNCEIGWIGGSKYKTSTRYGNGIQFFGPCNTVEVKNNWIYQCYDAGYTNQGNSGVAQNINVSENLIEYCAYSLELWMDAETGCIQDAKYSNNLMRFAGYEFERNNRVIGAVSHVNFMFGEQPCKNVEISGNTFDTSYVSLIVVNHPNSTTDIVTENGVVREGIKQGPTITDNTWIQRYDRYSFLAYQRVLEETSEGAVTLPANNLDEMKESVDMIDQKAKEVIFIK